MALSHERLLSEGFPEELAGRTLLVRTDGTQVPIDDSAAPVRDATGTVSGVVLVFRDITERKRLRAEAEAAQQPMQEAAE